MPNQNHVETQAPFKNEHLLGIIPAIDLGSSIAEQDELLESARVETSVLADLLNDKVDLIPGTKGSGKSALFRIFVEFLPDYLLKQKKAVIAHGVNRPGDSVFHTYGDQFKELDEGNFVNFWCIYIISLVHEQFIKNPRYETYLRNCQGEIEKFKQSCQLARIPEIKAQKSLREILAWALTALKAHSPKLKYKPPGDAGEFELTLFGQGQPTKDLGEHGEDGDLPRYMERLRDDIEAILKRCGLHIWFMIDKLDEIFPRRSAVERTALRGLLRTMRVFGSQEMRIKVFLRDDMLNEVVSGGEGFVALTHITARKADTLRWPVEQIMTMIVKRLFSSSALLKYLLVDKEKLDASLEYRKECFYKVFPGQVHKGPSQSSTLRWIYNHTADANGVVTPRDVIDLITKAKQHQYSLLSDNPSGASASIIGAQAIRYGLEELSKHKRVTYLEAEFPHLWSHIEKFEGGKAEYTERAIRRLLGSEWKTIAHDLRSIGLVSENRAAGGNIYEIPFVYRKGLGITQGRAA